MIVYLVQHGKAKNEEEDSERPLSDEGRAEVEKVAARAAKLGLGCQVMHSPKLRAKQTAEIFASHFKTDASEMEGLKPMDDPIIAKDFIESQDADVMLVGHLPHMNKLASLLVLEDGAVDLVAFRNGAIVCLERDEKWRLKWILTPKLS